MLEAVTRVRDNKEASKATTELKDWTEALEAQEVSDNQMPLEETSLLKMILCLTDNHLTSFLQDKWDHMAEVQFISETRTTVQAAITAINQMRTQFIRKVSDRKWSFKICLS